MIVKWKNRFGLNKLEIITEAINPQSVVYPDDCQGEERFFIGISINKETSTAIIYHDRPLTEEDVVHELLHVKYPEWSEEQVNAETKRLLDKQFIDELQYWLERKSHLTIPSTPQDYFRMETPNLHILSTAKES